jgi:hypothetical protein
MDTSGNVTITGGCLCIDGTLHNVALQAPPTA